MTCAIDIVELRQYTLKSGARDTLIALFEREFVESQEAAGMTLIGQFTDADNPDRFVWLRGFADMESRAEALASFYGGCVWKANREAANATMIDSDNVLLLRPAWKDSNFANDGARAPRGTTATPPGFVTATICSFDRGVTDAFIESFRDTMPARISAAGAKFLAALATEPSPNTFPALPVREGEHVFLWFSLFGNADNAQPVSLSMALQRSLSKPVEILRLYPTPRSRLLW
ncbi:MAG: NIPSNAP family protein [Proteobacteria bacterium]|nr:NIPSNAP family protein [Pseudomonadota bacterium]